MNNDGFINQLSKGKKIEQVVKEYLESRGNKVTDYSDNEEWQKVDTDFAIEDKNGKKATLEVKMDASLGITSNIYIESYSITKSGKNEGVLEKCKADYIAYYNPYNGKGIICKWEELKEALVQYHCEKRTKHDITDNKQREFYLFPMKKAEELNLIAHKWSK